MKLKQLFILLLIINSTALISVVFILSEYQNAVDKLETAYKMQHRSLILADELRQSSDDLTRMARTHVITGNDMFKRQFQTVLDIRNGIKPRPKHYNRIFWDFYTLTNSKPPVLDGKKIPLRTLMRQAGFPEEELKLLYESQKESDDLTNLETKAMNAIKGIFQDRDGNYTIRKKPNFKLAREIMHGEQYHKAKIAIMRPLNEFYIAFEKRTQQKVDEAHQTVKNMENYLSYAVLFLIILFIFSFIFVILHRIIHPVEILNKSMIKLAKNKMDIELPQKVFMDEISDMIGAVEVFKNNAIKLIESQKQNKRLLDLAGEGIFGLDAKGRFIFINPKASKLFGFSSKELIGKYLNKTIGKHLFKKDAQQKERLMLIQKEEQSFISKEGREFPIDYVSTPIYNNSSLLEGSVVVFSDITKRKEYENQLKTATIEAQKANRTKSIFLTNMSHELRTPLNAILGFTSLLKKSNKLNTNEEQNIDTIYSSGQHLLSIINEILEFAKIEAGKIVIEENEFNLYRFLDDIKSIFTSKCEDKGLSFSFKIEENVPKYIKCDEKRLRQIIINILGNALKFTQEGFIQTSIKSEASKLLISISDSGQGMDEEALKKVFKPFEQVGDKDYKNDGTGLGLAITKELIEKMQGSINVTSKLHKGSCFFFNIKIKKIDSIIEELNTHQKIINIKNANNINILVADDTKANRDLLVQFLNSYNIKAVEAKDGLEALEQVKKQNFDLIFMDMLMPNLNGMETTTILKNKEETKHIPIIAISANVFEEDKQKALDSKADYFLPKPFEEKDITNTLNKFLNIEFEYEEKIDKTFYLHENIALKIVSLAKELNKDEILQLIKKEEINTYTKTKITELVNSFQFEKLANLCIKTNH